jgi:hypothetical protein
MTPHLKGKMLGMDCMAVIPVIVRTINRKIISSLAWAKSKNLSTK